MIWLIRLEVAKRLPEDKKAGLDKLREVSRDMPENIKSLHAEEEAIKVQIAETEKARIYATQTLYQGVKLDDGAYGVRNIETNELMEVFRDHRPGMDVAACDWTPHMHAARNKADIMNEELNEKKA